MKITNISRYIAWILVVCMITAMIPREALARGVDLENPTLSRVVENEKTENTTIFDIGNGKKMAVLHGGNVRFKNEKGNLEDYDESLIKIKENEKTENDRSLSEYEYKNKTGDMKHYLPEQLTEKTPIIMENDNYEISMVPIGKNNEPINNDNDIVVAEKEKVPGVYTKEEDKKIKAIYGKNRELTYEYISGTDGIKENLILKKAPENNIFEYKFSLKGMYAKKNSTTEGITFYDKETGDIKGEISAPFMNDASNKAYSEEIKYELRQVNKEENTYILSMIIDKEYLNSEERVYPVTVDPSVSWVNEANLWDPYVCNGSAYKNINFYDSGIKVMAVGKGTKGTFQTYIRFKEITNKIKGKYVDSASLTTYETGDSAKGVTVGVHRVKTNWDKTSLTWSNKPSYVASAYSSIKTTGVAKSKKTFNLTEHVRKIANGTETSYGVMLRAIDGTTKLAYFYNGRFATTTYRPKLSIIYYDGPSTATTVATTNTYTADNSITLKWEGITSKSLNRVEYRVAKYNSAGTEIVDEYYVPYQTLKSTTSSSGSAVIPSSDKWPNGKYRIYIRGVDNGGIKGTGKGVTIYKDRVAPVISNVNISPTSTESKPSNSEIANLTWNITDNCKTGSLTFAVDGVNVGSSNLASSNVNLKVATSGKHTILMTVSDAAGNKTSKNLNYYADLVKPIIGEIKLDLDDSKIVNGWTQEIAPTILFKDITDDSSDFDFTKVKYAVATSNPSADKYKEIKSIEEHIKKPFSGTFRLSEEEQKFEDGKYKVYIKATDTAGNETVVNTPYYKDTTSPTGNIVCKDNIGQEITSLKSTVKIRADVSDGKGSGIKTYSLKLYDKDNNIVKTLIANDTISSELSLDTKDITNGKYYLKIEAEDIVGLKGEAIKEIEIANPINAPDITVNHSNDGNTNVLYKFIQDVNLKSIEYRINDGEVQTAKIEDLKAEGKFAIKLLKEGVNKLYVRGVDEADVKGQFAEADVIYDTAKPEIKDIDFKRGVVKGTIKDEFLHQWMLYAKHEEKNEYVEIVTGDKNVEDGEIATLNTSEGYFKPGESYSIKIVAEDYAGNQREEYLDIYIPADESCVNEIKPIFNIEKPTYENKDKNISFTLASKTKELKLKGDINLGMSTKWFVNNKKVSEEEILKMDFSKLTEADIHDILVLKESEDEKLYSGTIRENAVIENIDLQDVSAEKESKSKIIKFTKPTVSFRVIGDRQTEKEKDITYFVKGGSGEFKEINPNETIYVNGIDENSIYAEEIEIKISSVDIENIVNVTVESDTVEIEKFKVSSLYNYLPENISIKAKLNDRMYVYWNNLIPENNTELSYNVYRSDKENFEANETTLAAKGVKAGYFSELRADVSNDNTKEDNKKYYYKVSVAKTGKDGKVEESACTKPGAGKVIDYNELTKRLGIKEYWQYEDVSVPSGNVMVEKSKGNLVYSHEDATIPNEKLEVALTRTYNGQTTSQSALGKGWTCDFDMELLSVDGDNNNKFDDIILKDSTGTAYTFSRDKDGKKYISNMGKYFELLNEDKTEEVKISDKTISLTSTYTLKTKDKIEYRFNSSGQLVYKGEPNGNFLLFEYDDKTGVLAKVTTSKNLSMEFSYFKEDDKDDFMLIKEVKLPDGSRRTYKYSEPLIGEGSYLDETSLIGVDGKTVTTKYNYGNLDKKMSSFSDENGNLYSITYGTKDRVKSISLPENEILKFDYKEIQNEDGIGNITTEVSKNVKGKEISKTIAEFNSEGCQKSYTDELGKTTKYVYTDRLLTDTIENVTPKAINSQGYIVDGETVERHNRISYDNRENETNIAEADGTVKNMTYSESASHNKTDLLLNESETVGGVKISDTSYKYDEFANEIYSYDEIADEKTETEYDEDGDVISETESVEGTVTSETKYAYEYKPDGSKVETVTTITGKQKNITTTVIDPMGREMSSVTQSGKDSLTVDSKTQNTYDGLGRLIKTVIVEGTITTVTENSYDDNGNVVKEKVTETGQDGKTSSIVTTNTYDKLNRVISKTVDDNGEVHTATTDMKYEDVSVFAGKNKKETVENALVITETEGGDDSTTVVTYQDVAGRTVREKSNGIYVDKTYDEAGNVFTEYKTGVNGNEEGLLTVNLTNANGNKTATVLNPQYMNGKGFNANGAAITNRTLFDEANREIANIDGEGNKTSYIYNDKGEISTVIAPDGGVTRQSENLLTTETVTANGGRSQVTKDIEGNEIEIRDFGDSSDIYTKFAYDDKNNLLKETNAEGNYKTYAYDKDNRMILKKLYDKNGKLTLKTEYTYDNAGNITSMTDYKVVEGKDTLIRYTENKYDKQKKLISTAETNKADKSDLDKHKVSFEYAKDGKLTGVTYGYQGTGISGLSYEYNKYNWLESISADTADGKKKVREYTYDNNGKVEVIKDYKNFTSEYIKREYTYDTFERPIKMVYSDGNDEKEVYEYTYDKNSHIVSEKIKNNYAVEDAETVDEVRNYDYDVNGRLIKSVVTNNKTDDVKESEYEYDKVGNKVKESINDEVTTNTYNKLNQIVASKTANKEETVSNRQFTYDNNGNQIKAVDDVKGTDLTYTYDADNRISKVSGTSEKKVVSQENLYNGDGKRIKKIEEDGKTNYFYQNDSVLATSDKEDKLISFNIYGDGANVISTMRNTASGGKEYFTYNKDVRGSTSSIVDSQGTAQAIYYYDDFGNTTAKGNFKNEICYTGGIYDDTTGLYYLNARYYNPEDGNFMSQDIYRGEYTNPATLNYYGYCNGNPINYADPSGHAWETILDVVSVGWSVTSFAAKPSWKRFFNLAWDIGASFVPFVPGSYTVKATKVVRRSKRVSKVATKVPSTLTDLRRGRYLTIGKYNALTKMYKGAKLRKKIELHHIIEKRFDDVFRFNPKYWPAVAIDKDVHKIITKRFKDAYGYNTKRKSNYYDIPRWKMIKIVECVYYDMPDLKKAALKQIREQYRRR